MKKAVLLDRDGVINRAIVKNGLPTTPNSLDTVKIFYKDAVDAGFKIS